MSHAAGRSARPFHTGRRAFVAGLLALAGLVRSRTSAARQQTGPDPRAIADLRRRSAAFFAAADLDGARTVGRRFLAAIGATGEAEASVRLLEPTATLLAQAPDDAEAVARASRAVAADFDAGRVVLLDGWVLARTEAQICGLVAVLAAVPAEGRPGSSEARTTSGARTAACRV